MCVACFPAVLGVLSVLSGTVLLAAGPSHPRAVPGEISGSGTLDLVFSPQGERLATSGKDGIVKVWNLTSGTATELVGHTRDGDAWSVAFSPSGRLLASCGGNPGISGEVLLWNAQRGNLVATLTGHRDSVTCVAFSPDGRLLASASEDGSVRIWNLSVRNLAGSKSIPLRGLNSRALRVAYSPNGSLLAAACADGRICLYAGHTNQWLGSFIGHRAAVSDIAFSSDGRLASTSHDGTLRVWDVQRRSLIMAIDDANPARRSLHSLLRVAFTADDRTLVYHCADGSIKFRSASDWGMLGTIRARRESHSLGGYHGFAIGPHGHLAATGSGSIAQFWNLADLLPADASPMDDSPNDNDLDTRVSGVRSPLGR